MSSLLPFLVSPQNSSNVSGSGGIATESSTNVNKDQATPFPHTVSPAFAQVLRELHVKPSHQGNSESLAPIDGQADDAKLSFLTQKELENLEAVIGLDSLEKFLRESQILASAPLQRQAFQSTSADHASGVVSQTRVTNPLVLESVGVVPQAALSKVPAAGTPSPHGAQGSEVKLATFLPNQNGEQGIETLAHSGKETPIGLPQTNRLIQRNEPLTFSNHTRPTNSTIDLHHLRQNSVPLAPLVPPAGPAGFAQTDSISQLAVKPIPGNASIVNDLSGSVVENRTTVLIDPLGDTGLLNKGDRSQTLIDGSTKIMGLDASGGQGLGSGMNYPQNSQAGYQQSLTTTGQAMGVRGLEERVAEFPAPSLQRLQMDVQLSETQRVSIDVGVQNRQVYAGLVTDHAVLRTLATQFIPQLENQLADVDLDLQEFSAEVREERQEQDDPVFRHPSLTGQETRRASQEESLSPQSSLNRQGEPGLHLVA